MLFRYFRLASGLSLGLMLGSCQQGQSPGRAVYFGPTGVYRLTGDAQEIAPDSALTAYYGRRFNFHPRFNQPLHRLVRGSGPETVFLGLVLPPAPGNLGVLTASDSVWQQVAARAVAPGAAQVALLRNPRRGEYNVRYVGKNKKSGNTHVINLLTPDSTVARSYYAAEKLFKGNLLL